jgi:hypothetical protein
LISLAWRGVTGIPLQQAYDEALRSLKKEKETNVLPHQQRVIDEKSELDSKLGKLKTFFSSPVFASVDVDEQSRLKEQAIHMQNYSLVLSERINAFK